MMELNFLCEKKFLARLKQKTTFALMCFVKRIWKLNEFVACNWWKQDKLCVYQRF